MSSIPASELINVTPAVITNQGASLGMDGIFLTASESIPVGTLQEFANAPAVQSWFGASSVEYAMANVYFAGFNGAAQTPAVLYYAQYNTSAVSAWLRSASLAGMTLAELQALSGTISVAVNGETVTSANINLASATSFSNAAQLIQSGLQTTGGIFSGTGSVTDSSETLTITAVTSGALHVGDPVVGTGIPSGTTIASFGTGTGGVGTYNMSQEATATGSGETITVSSAVTVAYNSQLATFVITSPTTGAASTMAYPTDSSLSPSLLLTAAKGAVLSQGAAAPTPADLMDSLTEVSTNWATFTHCFDPDNGAAGGPIKQEFTAWNAGEDAEFMYVPWDTDAGPSTSLPDAACFAQQIASVNGAFPVWDYSTNNQAALVAAFVCGVTASIQYNVDGGRTDFAYLSSPVLSPDITNATVFNNVTGTPENPGNGYNSYGGFATRTTAFQWLQQGSVTGSWDWADSYTGQIFWNSQFQNDLAAYRTAVKNIPYTASGMNGIAQALASDIELMGDAGFWTPNTKLSSSVAQAVNNNAGMSIAATLESQGWYLLVQLPSASVQQSRGSPIIKFYYNDGGNVGMLDMTSTTVES